MTFSQLLDAIDQLPLQEQELIQQHIEANKTQEKRLKERVAGLGLGSMWMSEDFTAELPDTFGLGEE